MAERMQGDRFELFDVAAKGGGDHMAQICEAGAAGRYDGCERMAYMSEYGQTRRNLKAWGGMGAHEARPVVHWREQPLPYPFVVSSDFSQIGPARLMMVHHN
jgi:hypothetical protein